MAEDLVSIKELAKLLNISTASVNYYTNLGLFKINNRRGNIRLYNKNEVLEIFSLIQRLKREGYPLRLIQQKLDKGYNI